MMMNRVKRHRAVVGRVCLDHDGLLPVMRILSCSVYPQVSKAGYRPITGYENELVIGSYTIL
jgi:hypothetical protein